MICGIPGLHGIGKLVRTAIAMNKKTWAAESLGIWGCLQLDRYAKFATQNLVFVVSRIGSTYDNKAFSRFCHVMNVEVQLSRTAILVIFSP